MTVILSPAMLMHTPPEIGFPVTQPKYLDRTDILLKRLRQFNPWQLESLMKINPELALQAFQNYADFNSNASGTPAVLAYNGLVYKHFDAQSLSADDLKFASEHLRILSAFYGVLYPLDGILPHRLEMQTKLKIDKQSLYQFWGDTLYNDVISESGVIINLASQEYSRCIRDYLKPGERMIDIEFLANKKGKLKTIVAWAKAARGDMARFIMQNHIENPDKLKAFDKGYEFVPELSSVDKYTFVYTV
ncbi:MAG: peroxide stress protein YaaA [Oscillospiraceae bacterium]